MLIKVGGINMHIALCWSLPLWGQRSVSWPDRTPNMVK